MFPGPGVPLEDGIDLLLYSLETLRRRLGVALSIVSASMRMSSGRSLRAGRLMEKMLIL